MICFSQSRLLVAKTNKLRTTSGKAIGLLTIYHFVLINKICVPSWCLLVEAIRLWSYSSHLENSARPNISSQNKSRLENSITAELCNKSFPSWTIFDRCNICDYFQSQLGWSKYQAAIIYGRQLETSLIKFKEDYRCYFYFLIVYIFLKSLFSPKSSVSHTTRRV